MQSLLHLAINLSWTGYYMQLRFSIKSSTHYLGFLRDLVSVIAAMPGIRLDHHAVTACSTSLVEAVNNAIFHAHGRDSSKWIDIIIAVEDRAIEFKVCDYGPGFCMPALDIPPIDHIHGRGLFIIGTLMHEVKYKCGHKNTLEMVYKLGTGRRDMGEITYEKRAFKALYELSHAIMSSERISDVFEAILDKATDVIGVEKASIMRFEPKDQTLKIIAAKGLPKRIMDSVRIKAGEGISGRVFATGRPLLVEDVKTHPGASRRARYKSRSLISAPVTCLPLKVGGNPVGVVNMTDKRNGRAFAREDLELLTTIAAQAAAYIHIYDLAGSLKESERMRKEIEMAREIQAALLPSRVPEFRGVTAAGRCLMAERIGGDYYDFLSSGWSPPAFVVADVSGHDVGAALLMSAFRSALRAEAGIPVLPPSAVIRRMNRVLYEDLVKAEQFISVLYLQYIHSSRTLRYASAGHHPALLYRPGKGSFSSLITEGPLLGVYPGEHFFEGFCTVAKGDVVVMYTDGLIEAKDSRGRRFKMSRLKKAITGHATKSAAGIVDGICDDVLEFVGNAPLADDITLLVLKFA